MAADDCGLIPRRPTGRAVSAAAQPPGAAAQLALAWRSGPAQTCLVPGPKPLGGPHVVPRRSAARPVPDPVSRQAPQPPIGCLLHGTGLAAGRRALERPPACTHPLLAALARQVNDHTSDAGRQRLAELIPSVIGLTGEDLHIDARIALRAATTALPVVAAGRQRVMAVSVLTCDRVLADLDGRAAGALEQHSRLALAEVPQAAEWADRFTSGVRPSHRGFRRQAAPTIVQDAVQGIAHACVPDPDGMLRGLLVQAIEVCAAWVGRDRDHGAVVDYTLWVSAW
jgi:hypothetical protein